MTGQIRRACVSIPANIAEGCGKEGDTDMNRYFQIAMGSSSELDYELMLAHDLNYLNNEAYLSLSAELIDLRKMLNAFIQKLRGNR